MILTALFNRLLALSVSLNQKVILFIWDARLRTLPRKSLISSNIALLPYGSIDCELQYKILEKFFKRNLDDRYSVKYIKPAKKQVISNVPVSQKLLNYEEKISYFHQTLGGKNFDIIRGAIDEYRKFCSVEEMFEKTKIDEMLFKKILSQINIAKEIVDTNMLMIIPDLAYTKNRSIKHFSKEQGKKVIIINPYGMIRNISKNESLDPDPSEAEILNMKSFFNDDFDIKAAAKTYLSRRIRGETDQDLDAYRAFNQEARKSSLEFTNKKILFLHCIADAANVPIEIVGSDDMDLTDYFLWTREMFKIISKDPSQWLIKIHPASKLYPKDYEIIKRLIFVFQIPNEIIIPERHSTREILESNAVIFTHSGTIALESAGLGQRSVCVEGRYSDSVALNVRSIKAIEKLAEEKAFSLQEALKINSEDSTRAAIWLFLWRNMYKRGKLVSIKHPIQPNMTMRQYQLTQHKICIEFYKKVFSKNFHLQLSNLLIPYLVD